MIVFDRLRGEPAPRWLHWRSAAVIGGLMLTAGHGGVTWAEQFVPSGLAALLVATMPLWMVLLNAFFWDKSRPSAKEFSGILLGFAGVALLIGPEEFPGGGRIDLAGAVVLVLASLGWSAGSLFPRHLSLPRSPVLAVGLEMFSGGVFLFLLGFFSGDWSRFDLASVLLLSAVSLTYLIVFGSLIGFTAYIWLLKQTTPAKAATYAYVNPIVAVLLGWMVAGEALTPRTLLSATVIVAAVVIVTWGAGGRLRRAKALFRRSAGRTP